MQRFVTMYHPDAGTMECPEKAVRVHLRNGWIVVSGAVPVKIDAPDGGVLTTATVFPPEDFDDEADD